MSSHPWLLPDWAKEVQDISVQLDASFHHIPRGDNEIVDTLAKGVSRVCVSFDV